QRSPRFHIHEQGLPLEIMLAESPTLCLRDANGDALSCTPLSRPDNETEDSDAQYLVRQFHHNTFSLAYDISRSQRLALLGNSVIFRNRSQQQEAAETIFQTPGATAQ